MPQEIIYKVGVQSADDPMEFIMSTDTVDRHGDIVKQDWKLAEFKSNPIALFGHSQNFVIGTWEKVRVVRGQLIGKLKLAAAGTSDRIDEIRSLVEQRILKAVSVGFLPGEAKALDEDAPWEGMSLSKNSLLECSLVAVPANPDALQLAHLSKSMLTLVRDATVAECPGGACTQLKGIPSRDSDPTPKDKPDRRKHMSLSAKIEAKQAELTDLKNQLNDITENGVDDSGNLTDESVEQIDELTGKIAATDKALGTLERAEAGLAARAKAASPAPAAQGNGGAAPAPRVTMTQTRAKGHRAISAIATMVKAHATQGNPIEIAKGVFKDEPEIELIVRAATDPATVADATWAGPLVRDTWGEFIELIRDISVYPRIPGMRLEFDRYGKVTLPRNDGRGNLAGGFVGEGAPIPVKEGAYGNVDLSPKKMAVISTFTKEIANRSIPAIDGLLRGQILEDTAETIDTLFLDAVARDTIRPAGLRDTTETGAGNINASAGATIANVITDATGVLTRVMTARAATSGVWIMNPLRILGLRNKQDAANGEFTFRAELDAGTFMGYPYVASDNVTADVVVFVGGQAMAFGNDYAPTFDVSDQATLHMEDTTPEQIGTVAVPNVVAAPVRSMFQTDSIAVKMTTGMDWRIIRTGGVQVLTGVAW